MSCRLCAGVGPPGGDALPSGEGASSREMPLCPFVADVGFGHVVKVTTPFLVALGSFWALPPTPWTSCFSGKSWLLLVVSVCTCMCMRVCISARTCVYTLVHTCMLMLVYLCMWIYVCTHVCVAEHEFMLTPLTHSSTTGFSLLLPFFVSLAPSKP